MSLSDLITTENLDSYAEACREIGVELWVEALEGRCPNILMPSRGSFPILEQARRARDLEIQKKYGEFDPGYTSEILSIPRPKEIWLPFTAYCPDGSSTTSQGQREHWCKILKSILDNDESHELRIHRLFTEKICGRGMRYIEPNPNSKRVIIIDTVISGRAACEIATGLDEAGICDYLMLLAVDENGNRMHESYKARLSKLVAQGKAKLYFFKEIFTEDSHPGLTGITSVTFPQVTDALSKIRGRDTPVGFWHLEISRRPDNSNLAYVRTNSRVSTALYRRLLVQSGASKDNLEPAMNQMEREEFRELEDNGKVESKELARDFIRPVVERGIIKKNILDIDISQSFVASIYLNDKTIERIKNEILADN